MKEVLKSLEETGICVMRPIQQIDETIAWFDAQPIHVDAHVPQTARNEGRPEPVARETAPPTECFCVPTAAAITAPHLIERAMAYTYTAGAFLQKDPPVCYSANAFWTRAGSAPERPDIQGFHRDMDDERFLAMFVYLTDVMDDSQGPHLLEGPDGVVRPVYGPRGTVFLANTMLPHLGRKPKVAHRGIAWFRWGVSDRPPANQWDKVEPVPSSALGNRYPTDLWLRETMRLLVTPPPASAE